MALPSDIIDAEPTCYEETTMVSSKWIYKTKHSANGSVEKYKARFVVHGFSQEEGIDYEETFAPLERYTSIRAILVIAAVMKWKVHQMDVKTTFLNGVIEEEVYVEQPQGFETHDSQTRVQIEEILIWIEASTQGMVW